jgi:peptidoglycan-associated lipoprotein
MKARLPRVAGMLLLLSSALFLGACGHKKVAVAQPVAPPAPAKPTATLSAKPTNVQRGQSVQLTWNTQNATDVSIDAVGSVSVNGSRGVSPTDSTTYTLTAKGPGGTVQATARVTVTIPPVPVKAAGPSDQELFNSHVKDIFFDYDKADLRQADGESLKGDADFLQSHPNIKVLISGHCDERGSEDYNLALGTNRADGVRAQLQKLGISGDRIRTVSYGKEKPFCNEENDNCWQQNRRAHFVLDR